MVYALDINTLSYAMRDEGGVAGRMRQIGPATLALPAVVVFEMRYGLLRAGRLRQLVAFEAFVASLGQIGFDTEAADHAARIRLALEAAGTPIGLADLLIAATARRHGCTLVTHNSREFSRVPGLLIEDWY
ncbi:MAG: type II toxin-antitoxin system VapC family toxin [Betaproteobacteria bacterium]|nr:type II toxin-antitoxin system VapC family toxin [Betaproteobacteria bacterium]